MVFTHKAFAVLVSDIQVQVQHAQPPQQRLSTEYLVVSACRQQGGAAAALVAVHHIQNCTACCWRGPEQTYLACKVCWDQAK